MHALERGRGLDKLHDLVVQEFIPLAVKVQPITECLFPLPIRVRLPDRK